MRLAVAETNRSRLAPALAVLLALALPGAAAAKTTDRNAPMDIDAGRSDSVLTDDGDAVLSGGVTITQGTLQVKSEDATIHRKGGEISQVVLTGGVVIEQPRGNMRGESVTYDLKSGRLNGGGDGGRVKMTILPKNKS